MNVGLIDIDGHNFPNLALMKISAYHKSLEDNVEWVTLGNYDKVYMSKIFTFSPDHQTGLLNYGTIIKGGTGYNYSINLPSIIDNIQPDYSIYPKFNSAYGFLTRGCPNKCSWCIVPLKEGDIKPYMDIDDILQGRKSAILMDNNVLASEWGIKQIEKIIKLKIKIDFNQGLDARLIDRPTAKLLSKVRWLSPLRMSCDTMSMIKPIKKAIRYLREYDCTPSRYFIYVLVKDIESAYKRVMLLDKLGCDPFAQPFIDFSGKNKITKEQKQFARWVNHKAIFRSVEFKNYKPYLKNDYSGN
jgi:hypothetical protein